jgi:hypothetical protein
VKGKKYKKAEEQVKGKIVVEQREISLWWEKEHNFIRKFPGFARPS